MPTNLLHQIRANRRHGRIWRIKINRPVVPFDLYKFCYVCRTGNSLANTIESRRDGTRHAMQAALYKAAGLIMNLNNGKLVWARYG